MCRIIEAAIDAGASTINIPDTVGYNIPKQFGDLIERLLAAIPNAHKAVFSAHCHNDLGLAVANALAAVQSGARQVECTINGLGERAGNTALEEVVMAVRTRQDVFGVDTQIETPEILPTSRLVSGITGFSVQPNKAIVGANAFAHESGIHQDGVLKHRETYEIMRAEDVGWSMNRMVLGKHSGRNAFRDRCLALGIDFESQADLSAAFQSFKALADRKHEIYDEDIQALVTDQDAQKVENEQVRLEALTVETQTGAAPTATVTLQVHGQTHQAKAQGSGVVDATFKAIEMIVQSGATLALYSVSNVTDGTDALGETAVRMEKGGRIVNGQGADTDIVQASAKAYLNALNKLMDEGLKAHPQAAV